MIQAPGVSKIATFFVKTPGIVSNRKMMSTIYKFITACAAQRQDFQLGLSNLTMSKGILNRDRGRCSQGQNLGFEETVKSVSACRDKVPAHH